jgi:integral membrane sensor domain MASE1
MHRSSNDEILPDSRMTTGALPRIQNAALLAIAYFAIAGLGHSLSPADDAGGFFWLPAGLLLSALFLTPRREWPILVAGALAGDAAFGFAHGLAPVTIAIRTIVTVVQGVIGAEITERICGRPFEIRAPRDLLVFVMGAAVLATFAGGLVGAVLSGGIGDLADSLLPRWQSSGLAVLVLTPAVLQWSELPEDRTGRLLLPHPIEAALLVFATIATTAFVFGNAEGLFTSTRILLLVPVVWAGLRYGLHAVTSVVLFESLPTAFWAASEAADLRSGTTIASAQAMIAMISLLGMALVVLRQRRRSER